MNMWFKSSTNRKRTSLFRIWTPFNILVQVRICLVVIDGEISPKKEMVFHSRDSCKQCVSSPPNNIIVGFWSLKGIFKTWQQALHFLQS